MEHRFRNRDEADLRVEQGREIQRPSVLYLRGRRAPDGFAVSIGGRVFESMRGELR